MKTILVVDDEHDIADTTAILMNLLGYCVRTAYGGRDAVDAVATQRPDVVLLDLNMPGLDGFEAARQIRARYASPPPTLIAVSALARPGLAGDLRSAGFDHHLPKPVDVDRLVALVDNTPG